MDDHDGILNSVQHDDLPPELKYLGRRLILVNQSDPEKLLFDPQSIAKLEKGEPSSLKIISNNLH